MLSLNVALGQPALAGSAILVFATESNGGNAGLPITVSDAAGNPYSLVDQVDDKSNAAWQSLFSFGAYNVPAGTVSVTVNYKELEWQGVLVVEVAGVTSLPLITHAKNLQVSPGTAANGVTSGTMIGGLHPATVIALSMANLDFKGAPGAGTGYSAAASVWNWNGEENTANVPSTLLEYQHFADPGDVAPTFTALISGDDFSTLALVFAD